MTLLPTDIDPLEPLQLAMYATLKGDAVLPTLSDSGEIEIYDRVSDGVYPYITIGDDRLVPDDIDCGTMSEIFSTIRVYSRGKGRTEAKRIAGRVRWLLDKDRGFAVEGFKTKTGVCESADPRTHQDGVTVHYEINFRYILTAIDPRALATGGGLFAGLISVSTAELAIGASANAMFAPLQSTATAEVPLVAEGVGSGVFAGVSGQAAGALRIDGVGNGAFAPLIGDATADFGDVLSGIGDASFAPIASAATAALTLTGVGSASFAGVSGDAGAQIGNEVTATGDGSFAPITSIAIGELSIEAAAVGSMAPLTSTGQGALRIEAIGSALFAPVAAGTGELAIDAIGNASFAPVSSTATSTLAISANGAGAFAGVTGNAAASVGGVLTANAFGLFAAIESQAMGQLAITGNAAGAIAGLQGSATGAVAIGAIGDGSFAPISSTSSAALAIAASGAGALAPVSGTATATIASSAVTVTTVQSATDSGNPATAVLASTPVEGNLLVAISGHRKSAGDNTISGSGWTQHIAINPHTSDSTWRRGLAVWTKIAGASEPTSITADYGDQNSRLLVVELEVDGATPVVDVVATDGGPTANVTTQTSGTTAAVAQNDNLILAAFQYRDVPGVTTFSNDFGDVVAAGGTSELEVQLARKVDDTGGTKETTASYANATGGCGGIIVFSLT